ncbi:hypothetical protein G5I_04311 [Acromyrmex echinatior]|uniref:Uncharacterized protein n=1 Tax=Acromyrmex echinatior TaxID=103372 RepID=F4WFA4_ACREC|nr:hypothetical protein G5I_04311 [Acromyrmex echinatior]
MLTPDLANASDGTASIHRRRDDKRTFPYRRSMAGTKLPTPGSAVGYTRIPASHRVGRTYVAAFNKACNPQTTEDADTWLVYGGL